MVGSEISKRNVHFYNIIFIFMHFDIEIIFSMC